MDSYATLVPAEEQIYALDLDYDLISHLANADAVQYLRAEQVDPIIVEDDLAREVLEWQLNHLRREGQPATASVLEDEFEKITISKPETTITDLVRRLRQRYVRNESRKVVRDLTRLNGEDPLSVASEMLQQGRRLTELTIARGERFSVEDVDRARMIYDKKLLKGPGPTLGFRELDDHFTGIKGMTFLLAPPKTYKSWGCVNAVEKSCRAGGKPHLYSLELPAEDTDMRIRCMAADVPFWKNEKGCLTNDEWARIHEATEELLSCGSYEVSKPPPGERSPHKLVEQAMSAGATAIYIDQLQYVENEKGTNLGALNDTGSYWDALSVLRDYSDEIPMFIVHQFNRSVMKAKEMPEMQQAKGSSALEEIGHLVLGLWANKEMRRNNVVEIGTLASRSYSYKSWQLDVSLSHGCALTMMGEVQDDDE